MAGILLSGCNGKMGKAVTANVAVTSGAEIIGGIDIYAESLYGYPVFGSPALIPDDITEKADVIIDFSNPSALGGLLEYAVKNNIPAVICTTGLNEAQKALIKSAAEKIPVFFSANMSLGVNLVCELAKKAAELDEVPIGCVIVHEGKVIARGYNRRNTDKSTLAHAEIAAIRKASRKLSDWRLEECTLYVTLEPCQMCAGAIVQARTSRVVIGAMNPKAGCAGSIVNLLEMKEFNHRVDVTRGVLEEQCSQILKDFFAGLRKRVKEENTNEDKM